MRTITTGLGLAGPLAAAVLFAACQGDSTGSSGQAPGVGLSFAVAAAPAGNKMLDAGPGGHTLDLSQVQLVVGRIRLRRSSEAEPGCAGPNEQHPCTEFKAGPVLVDLPVHGGIVTPITSDIPPGSYRFLLINIFPPAGDDSAFVAFRAAHNWPALGGMRVKGTYDGQAFDLFLNVKAEIYNQLDPPFVVTADSKGPLNVTIAVDPHAWFKTGDGTLIDPRALTADQHLLELVTSNVRASFKAFSDNQRHGTDDHHG